MPATKTVKEIINILCVLLDPTGVKKLSPEIFRRAKFDDGFSVPVLKTVLAELLVFLKSGTLPSGHFLQSLTRNSDDEDLDIFIYQELSLHGSPICGRMTSRFLLLNICALIGGDDLLEKLILSQSLKLGEYLDSIEPPNPNSIVKLSLEHVKLQTDPIAKAQSFQWLYGTLLANMKLLKSMSEQKAKLVSQLHAVTDGAGFSKDRSHLSMLEVYLLRHPDTMETTLKLVNDDNDRLEKLLEWKENEHIFWKWMDSVLDAYEKSDCKCSDEFPIASSDFEAKRDRLSAAHNIVQQLISAREDSIDRLDKWTESDEIYLSTNDKDVIAAEVEEQIENSVKGISKSSSFLHVHYPNLLSFSKNFSSPPRDRNQNYIGQTSPEKVDPLEMYDDVDSLIPRLERKIFELDIELRDLKSRNDYL